MVPINKNTFELFKEMYIYELENKEKINGRITIPIGIVTILLGLAVNYFKSFRDIDHNWWGVSFFVIYGLFVISLIIAIVLVFRSYYNYKYHYLPDPENLDKFGQEVVDYYEQNYEKYFKDKGDKEILIEKDINEKLYSYYKNCTTENIKMNDKKLKYLRYTGYALIVSVFLAAFSVIPYQLSFKNDETVKVKIEQQSQAKKELEKSNGGAKE